MSNPQVVNKVIIGIACPIYAGGAKRFSEAKADFVRKDEFDRGRYVWEWQYKETFVELYLREDGREDGRTLYNKHFICPHCRAELLLSVDNCKVIALYRFSKNDVAHYINHKGFKTNRLFLLTDGTVDENSEKRYQSTNIYRTADALDIPTDYFPKHPEVFSDDWKVKNLQALERIEDLSDDEIAILLVTIPRHAVVLLNDAKTGIEIAKRVLKSTPKNLYDETGIPKPDTFELLSAMTPFIDGRSSTNLTTALLYTYDKVVNQLYWQIVIAGICSFLFSLGIQFIDFPGNAIVSVCLIPTITIAILSGHWMYLKEVRQWQALVKWLPENKRMKHAILFKNIYILTQIAFIIVGLRGCVFAK
jgi:hypothetical protein